MFGSGRMGRLGVDQRLSSSRSVVVRAQVRLLMILLGQRTANWTLHDASQAHHPSDVCDFGMSF